MTEKEKVQLAPCAPAGWMDSLLGAEQRVNSYLSSLIHSSWLSFKILGVIQGKTSAGKAGDVPSGGSGLTAGINSFTFRTSPTAAAVSESAGASGAAGAARARPPVSSKPVPVWIFQPPRAPFSCFRCTLCTLAKKSKPGLAARELAEAADGWWQQSRSGAGDARRGELRGRSSISAAAGRAKLLWVCSLLNKGL